MRRSSVSHLPLQYLRAGKAKERPAHSSSWKECLFASRELMTERKKCGIGCCRVRKTNVDKFIYALGYDGRERC